MNPNTSTRSQRIIRGFVVFTVFALLIECTICVGAASILQTLDQKDVVSLICPDAGELLENMNWDLYVVDVASGETTNLTNSPESEEHFVLSPDGSQIGYMVNVQGRFEIYVLTLANGQNR